MLPRSPKRVLKQTVQKLGAQPNLSSRTSRAIVGKEFLNRCRDKEAALTENRLSCFYKGRHYLTHQLGE